MKGDLILYTFCHCNVIVGGGGGAFCLCHTWAKHIKTIEIAPRFITFKLFYASKTEDNAKTAKKNESEKKIIISNIRPDFQQCGYCCRSFIQKKYVRMHIMYAQRTQWHINCSERDIVLYFHACCHFSSNNLVDGFPAIYLSRTFLCVCC